MVDGVEPLAHAQALPDLHFDLFLAQGLQQHEGDSSVEGSCVQPAWQESLSHDRGEVALSDVEHVGGGEDSAGEVGGLTDTLSVVESVDDCLVQLPVVVIHP